MREYKKKLAEEKLQNEAEARHPRTGEEALWRHLDELELREELQDELDLYVILTTKLLVNFVFYSFFLGLKALTAKKKMKIWKRRKMKMWKMRKKTNSNRNKIIFTHWLCN